MSTCRSTLHITTPHAATSAPFLLYTVVHYGDTEADIWDEILVALTCHECHKPVAIEDGTLVHVAVANLDRLQNCEALPIGDEVMNQAAQTITTLEGPAVVCCRDCSRKVHSYACHALANVGWLSTKATGGEK
jgi:hypothetical protein